MMARTTLVCHSPAGSRSVDALESARLAHHEPSPSYLSPSTNRRLATSKTFRSAGHHPMRRCGAVPPAHPPSAAIRAPRLRRCQRPCARRRCSPTPRCAGCWKSSTAAVPRPSCGRCWRPASSTRCSRPAAHSSGRGPDRKPPPCCAGCGCNRSGGTIRTPTNSKLPRCSARTAAGTGSTPSPAGWNRCRQLIGARWLVVALHIG